MQRASRDRWRLPPMVGENPWNRRANSRRNQRAKTRGINGPKPVESAPWVKPRVKAAGLLRSDHTVCSGPGSLSDAGGAEAARDQAVGGVVCDGLDAGPARAVLPEPAAPATFWISEVTLPAGLHVRDRFLAATEPAIRRWGRGRPSRLPVLGYLPYVLVSTGGSTLDHLIEQVGQPQPIQ